MKGLVTFSFFAALYFLLIIIFFEVAGEPRGVQQQQQHEQSSSNVGQQRTGEGTNVNLDGITPTTTADAVKETTTGAKHEDAAAPSNFGHVAGDAAAAKKKNATVQPESTRSKRNNGTNSPLADLFQIQDPNMKDALGIIYGTYRGNDQCSRKAFCLMGNYMKDMPGRDLIFLMMGQYIPPEYNLYYEIFKVAVLYGQNCDVYVCVPNTDAHADAAAAADPHHGSATPPEAAPQVPSPQEPNAIPR